MHTYVVLEIADGDRHSIRHVQFVLWTNARDKRLWSVLSSFVRTYVHVGMYECEKQQGVYAAPIREMPVALS